MSGLPERPLPSLLELERMNVRTLRQFVRSLPAFPIHGRAVSVAVRTDLLQMLKSYLEQQDTERRRNGAPTKQSSSL